MNTASATTVVHRPGADPSAPPFLQIVSKFGDSIALIEVKRNGAADTSLAMATGSIREILVWLNAHGTVV